MGSFMAAQVVADIKYAKPMLVAPDWWTFAASGPGSRRGLNIVFERDMAAPWTELEWRAKLNLLKVEADKFIEKVAMPRLHAQDLQNCLCEHSKWTKVHTGVGTPRSLYPGV